VQVLCQAGLQGTNRPALYHVLLDENNFTATDLQMLTYRCNHQKSLNRSWDVATELHSQSFIG